MNFLPITRFISARKCRFKSAARNRSRRESMPASSSAPILPRPGRNDFGVYIGYTVNLTRSLTGSAVARLAVRDYVDVDRTDVSGIFSVGATYHVSQWFSMSAISSFATNDSNINVFDYNVFNIGGALSGTFRF